MDDLNGLSWTTSSKSPMIPLQRSSSPFASALRSSNSGRATPASTFSNISNPPSKPATPANDSFANLVSFSSSSSSSANNRNMSLLEQQKILLEQKAKQEAARRAQLESQYGGSNSQFWDAFEQKKDTSSPLVPQQTVSYPTDPEEDNLLAAFNASAPVDKSSHFPPPSSTPFQSRTHTPVILAPTAQTASISFPGDDDDLFGLGQMKAQQVLSLQGPTLQATNIGNNDDDDDDFLGLLGRPVSEFPRQQEQQPHNTHIVSAETGRDDSHLSNSKSADPRDHAIAELVDMGFATEKAVEALDSTESGTDVQAAVGWLLNQAHAESHQKARSGTPKSQSQSLSRDRRRQNEGPDRNTPSWMREELRQGSRSDSRPTAPQEKDATEMASEFGSKIFKTANSLWKTGAKRVQKAVQDFQTDSDPSQPRWMKEATTSRDEQLFGPQESRPNLPSRQATERVQKTSSLTDEALLLEPGDSRPTRNIKKPKEDVNALQESRSEHRPPTVQPRREESPQLPYIPGSRRELESRGTKSRLSRGATEELSAQAYVSPARRRRPAQHQESMPAGPVVDLFRSPELTPTAHPGKSPVPVPRSTNASKPSTPLPPRLEAPPRTIPPVSPSSLSSSNRNRLKGNEAYKRGDYAYAHEAFTKALSDLPSDHPVTIIILSNRAMTALKIGEPKTAISDADVMLTVIGPLRGEGESINVGDGEPAKAMRDLFGKALMRKAEALEHLERWEEAAKVWRQAVETGHGSSTSIQGRNRCEKAAGINKSAPSASPAVRSNPTQPKKNALASVNRSALDDLSRKGSSPATTKPPTEALNRLRAANAAADRADEEKLALTDTIDTRITAWKGGKQDNLRALLASLDNVLWPEAGWKKINMSELVLPNKVKIQYMKGIAKVHPDKIPTNATTEQRMIAGAVFSSLNEAWDKFRKENNL